MSLLKWIGGLDVKWFVLFLITMIYLIGALRYKTKHPYKVEIGS